MVKEVEISKLNEAEYNPRITLMPGMPEYEKLKRSIEEFGNVEPIVWNSRTGNVVGGHQRLTVLKNAGCKTVPCSVVDLSPYDEKLLNVALNKIKGKWDYDKLEDILSGFDDDVATLTGFAEEEIAVLLANNDDLISDAEFYGDDEEDWFSEEGEIVGGGYVVTLIFEDTETANLWAQENGYKDQIREGSYTTVIRVEE